MAEQIPAEYVARHAELCSACPTYDPEAIAELDGVLWRVAGNWQREGSGPGSRFEGQTMETVQVMALLHVLYQPGGMLAGRGTGAA